MNASPNRIDERVVMHEPVTLGTNNFIGAFTCINTTAQIKPPGRPERTGVTIGNDNIIREFVSINEGTIIGNDNFIMAHSHIDHECTIGDSNIMAAPTLSGHVNVMNRVNLGMRSVVHQFVTIGTLAMVGMGAVVVHDVPPFVIVAGNPARVIGWNRIGMKRAGITDEFFNAHVATLDNDEYRHFMSVHKRKIVKTASTCSLPSFRQE